MSLACIECDKLMGPTSQLPGHDGMLVSPVLRSLVWRATADGKCQWALHPVLAKAELNLCFRCFKSKVRPPRSAKLALVYTAIAAETAYTEHDKSQLGKWMTGEEASKNHEHGSKLFEKFRTANELIEKDSCLLCGTEINQLTDVFLVARSFDRVFCRQFKAGLLGEANYSVTNHLPTGMTSFNFCFNCLAQSFPRTCQGFSEFFGGEQSVAPKDRPTMELLITEEVAQELREQLGIQEAEKQFRRLGAKIVGPSQN